MFFSGSGNDFPVRNRDLKVRSQAAIIIITRSSNDDVDDDDDDDDDDDIDDIDDGVMRRHTASHDAARVMPPAPVVMIHICLSPVTSFTLQSIVIV